MNTELPSHRFEHGPLKLFIISVAGMYGLHLMSRLVGLYRDSLTAQYLGTTAEADAFFIGSWLPFCAVNVVNAAITPLLIRELAGESERWSLIVRRGVFTLAAIIVVPMSLILVSGRWLIEVTGPSLPNDQLPQCHSVLIVTSILAYVASLNFLLAAAANSQRWFVLPRLLDTFLPIGACLGILFLYPRLGIVGISLNMLLAVLVAHLGYVGIVYHLGGNLRPWRPSLRALAESVAGIMPYVGGCVLINITYLYLIRRTSLFGAGSVTILMLSDRIWNVVRGLVEAWTLVAMPRLVEVYRRHSVRGASVLPSALYAIGALYVIAIGLVSVAGHAIIRFLFERGLFAAESSGQLAETVFWYGFAAALVSAGYFTEYHMIAAGHARRTFWGGATQLISFLLLLHYGGHFGVDASDADQVLKLFIVASLVRLLALLCLAKDQLGGGATSAFRELLFFSGVSSLFLWILDGLSTGPLFDGQHMVETIRSVSAWAAATAIYIALLAVGRVRGVSDGIRRIAGLFRKAS